MRIRPYVCQHVAVLYIKHGLSIVICCLGGVGVVVAKKQAQNTLVSILNPTVLTCDVGVFYDWICLYDTCIV